MTVGLLSFASGLSLFTPSQRNLVNVNIPGTEEYPFILFNKFYGMAPKLNLASPFDGVSLNPYPQQIDANGYPYTQQSSGQNINVEIQAPSSTNFSGPWVLTWDGEGSVAWANGTWTASNGVTSGTATFNGTSTISFTNSLTANNQRISFTTSVAGFVAFTVYYIVAATGTTIQIAATPGGSPIIASGSGTATLQGTFTGTTSFTNVVGQSAYIILNNSGYAGGTGGYNLGHNVGTPANISTITWSAGTGLATVTMSAGHSRPIGQTLWLAIGGNTTSGASLNGPFLCTITGATTFTFATANPGTVSGVGTMWSYVTNVRLYQLADEADLLAGKNFRRAWMQPYINLRPSAVRTMNWSGGNLTQLYDFRNRSVPSNQFWGYNSSFNFNVGPAYNRPTGFNDWTLAAVTSGTVANPQTTPASIVHGETVQFQLDQSTSMGGGPQMAISSITQASPAVITTTNPHGRFTGDKVWFTITSGMPQLNSGWPTGFKGALAITVTGANTFTVAVDSSGFTAFGAGFFNMASAGGSTISAFSYGSTTTVTTSANHNFTASDNVIFTGTGNNGLIGPTNLNALPVVVASVISATQFTFTNLVSGAAYNTTGFPAFTSGNGKVVAYTTLNVKRPGGGDAKFPLAVASTLYVTNNAFMSQGLYRYAVYDQTAAYQADGAGNPIFGAWIIPIQSQQNAFATQEVPIEIQTALILEMNALAASQSITQPIHMYYNIPTNGIDSNDPGATSQSMWGTNAVSVIMNGANGYAGLSSNPNLKLLIEYSNETWNFTSQGLGPSQLIYRAISRWSWSNFSAQSSSYTSINMFRTTGAMIDIANAFPSLVGNKIIRIMSGPPNNGSAVGSVPNLMWTATANVGTNFYINDATVIAGGWGAPSGHLDGINVAPYVNPLNAYGSQATTGTGCFNDDYAIYYGTDNSGALSCTGGTGAAFTATFTAATPGISATNTFVAGNLVTFGTTVGNIIAGTAYTVSATGLSGSSFQITLNGSGITPNTNGSSTGTPTSTSLTITASNGTAFVNGQPLVGTGITANPKTYIVSQSGSIPSLVLTLNQNATVANGTTITSPANSGGNYIGAADQSAGRRGFVTNVVNGVNVGGGPGFAYYTAFYTNVSGWLTAGKYLFGYEGGQNWATLAGQGFVGGRTISGSSTGNAGEQGMLIDIMNSPEWGTALVSFFNTCGGLPNIAGNAIYTVNSGGNNQQQFCFCSPDSYASGVEGQALTNSGSWSAMSTRNAGLA